ncbi:hypothetical protein [Proteus hauseri]|uniref:hypothetical protein n=1 Tax=Proteus hauseri TaxID=183417 RepID=UPI0010097504|nr:hypothetical protein [Proteus hauseri]QAV22567.1 hypothetical protein PH4a_04105 [Proteus hauseri]
MADQIVRCVVIDPSETHTMIINGVLYIGSDIPIDSFVYQSKINYDSYIRNYKCIFNVPSTELETIYYLERQELKIINITETLAIGSGISANVYRINNLTLGIVFYTNRDTNSSLSPNVLNSLGKVNVSFQKKS